MEYVTVAVSYDSVLVSLDKMQSESYRAAFLDYPKQDETLLDGTIILNELTLI